MTNYNELMASGLEAIKSLNNGKMKDYTGWMKIDKSITKKIQKTAKEIQENSDVFVVVGVGGSSLGAKAVIEALSSKFNRPIEVLYMGDNFSPLDTQETLDYLKDKDFTVNVISKSGSTLETSIAFELLKELLLEKYSEKEALSRIIVTTDIKDGKLRKFVNETNVQSFVIPKDVGGRYSVLTPVGLLPIAVAGIDIEALLSGAEEGSQSYTSETGYNSAIAYAAMRNLCHLKEEKDVELLALYEPRLKYLGEWWKQLFGESEGKNGKGIFPATAIFSTDLHSIGQLVQDGKKNLFETHLVVKGYEEDFKLNENVSDLTNIPKGKTLGDINYDLYQATVDAHNSGSVTSISIPMYKLNAYSIGKIIYFFMISCAISALILEVNPFDQPGVEEYKKNLKSRIK